MSKEKCEKCNRKIKKRPRPDWCGEDDGNYRCIKCGEYFDPDWDLPDQCDRCKDLRRTTAKAIVAGIVSSSYGPHASDEVVVRRAINLADKMEDALDEPRNI